MGNSIASVYNFQDNLSGKYFIIERQLVNEPVNIKFGVCGGAGEPSNPYKTQCIKINNESRPHSLLTFCETSNALIMDFEDNIRLTLMKSSDDKINYNIKTNSINMTNELDTFHRTWIKPVLMGAPELDKMVRFIKLPETDTK
jgi:hypothetical protein